MRRLALVVLGQLDVTLRNPDDVDVIEDQGRATLNTLLSGERLRVLTGKRYGSACCILRHPEAP